ncbi:MAG: hypothetical protein AAF404_12080, partial [Pseudomonadota bacterium]
HLRFYAGAPLRSPEGYILGSFCIIDFKPRKLSWKERCMLEELSKEAVFHMIQRVPRCYSNSSLARYDPTAPLAEEPTTGASSCLPVLLDNP